MPDPHFSGESPAVATLPGGEIAEIASAPLTALWTAVVRVCWGDRGPQSPPRTVVAEHEVGTLSPEGDHLSIKSFI